MFYVVKLNGKLLYLGESIPDVFGVISKHSDIEIQTSFTYEGATKLGQSVKEQEKEASDFGNLYANFVKEVIGELNLGEVKSDASKMKPIDATEFLKNLNDSKEELVAKAQQMGTQSVTAVGEFFSNLGTYLKKAGEADRTNE